ncbi:DUF2190 family protein [Seohaeicola nanhaiensis]|uniref:DUF2190 family protein n=1 Tax=Seohaeicola nanhaiensis TaxID=1387282 RepID=A0ABV9KHW3_9RHOB
MKNYVAPGDMFPFTPSGADYVSGQGALSGTLFGVCAGDIADGEEGEIETTGVFQLPKTPSQAWTVGAKVYWTSGGVATTTASGNTLIGVAYAAVGSGAGETLGLVRLNGIPA